ncbi:MAG: lipoate--protein ligase family protein, partial [Verrucomicrobia bacterium]|nr:lipoate--protein ligase family protein [Verrucomicrobiota bacterium]
IDSAERIMQKDQELLEKMPLEKDPILHFYEWNGPSATYGYFLDPNKFFCMNSVEKLGLQLARRPTGGGIIFHLWDFAFSALIPSSHPSFSQNTLQNYAYINLKVLAAVEEFLQIRGFELTDEDGQILGEGCGNFCMAKPTRYDVMLGGRKVAGAAQRKTKGGFLHQGSISLVMPSKEWLQEVLLSELNVLEAMSLFTFPLLGEKALPSEVPLKRKEIQKLIIKHFIRDNV